MRNLTLDEKIGIKGLLSVKGYCGLAGLVMKDAIYFFSVCYGKPISMWNTKKQCATNRYKNTSNGWVMI